jgi:GT2 family glycosyltransferase
MQSRLALTSAKVLAVLTRRRADRALIGLITFIELSEPQKFQMFPRTAVIVATRERPQELINLLDALKRQTIPPDRIIISACEARDVPSISVNERVEIILGSPGSSVQRNRAWVKIKGTADIIVFFDDDFIPSRFWIERVCAFLTAYPDVVCLTGRVIVDGAKLRELDWPKGLSVVDKADLWAKPFSATKCTIRDKVTPYGCNMAIRAEMIEHLSFDERLVLYGWLEDRDLGIRAATAGRTIWTDAVWGVHLGVKKGRQSGLRFGYSQMVNPWYLMKKGTLTPSQTGQNIVRGLLGNLLGSLVLNSRVDRRGRLKGNFIGIKDIISGCWAPERVMEL